MGNIFQFKRFSVNQEDCAMRINTDGVLLGAIANNTNSESILDIGTGTGVIALMLAQRFETAKVWAVEIDKVASERAADNFQQSNFSERLEIVNSDIFKWDCPLYFDLIVSNPPFYINSLHNPDLRKKVAKHTDIDFFKGMMAFASYKLNSDGKLQIVVPIELLDFLVSEAKLQGLFLTDQINIKSFPDSDVFRCILSFKKLEVPVMQDNLILYKERSVYTDSYKDLLKPYFLAF